MLKISEESLARLEAQYPGIGEAVRSFEGMTLPRCFRCGTEDTALVNVGLIGRTIALAAATTKFKLVANAKPGDYFCNVCNTYFD